MIAEAALVATAERIGRDLAAGRHAAARARFSSIVQPEIARDLVTRELTALLLQETAPAKSAPEGQLRITRGPCADLRLRVVRPGEPAPATIATLTRPTLVGNAGQAPFALRRWRQPEPFPNDVFDAARTIEPPSVTVLRPREVAELRAGYDAYEIATADRAAVAFVIGGAHELPLAWTYRRDTRRATSVQPVARDWLRTREVITFAGALCDASLAPAAVQLAEHPSHFVRWAAAKCAVQLAPDRAAATLSAFAGDPHPHVRAAVRQLLQQLPA
jgi:hypothetical protein